MDIEPKNSTDPDPDTVLDVKLPVSKSLPSHLSSETDDDHLHYPMYGERKQNNDLSKAKRPTDRTYFLPDVGMMEEDPYQSIVDDISISCQICCSIWTRGEYKDLCLECDGGHMYKKVEDSFYKRRIDQPLTHGAESKQEESSYLANGIVSAMNGIGSKHFSNLQKKSTKILPVNRQIWSPLLTTDDMLSPQWRNLPNLIPDLPSGLVSFSSSSLSSSPVPSSSSLSASSSFDPKPLKYQSLAYVEGKKSSLTKQQLCFFWSCCTKSSCSKKEISRIISMFVDKHRLYVKTLLNNRTELFDGGTPLHVAAFHKNELLVFILLTVIERFKLPSQLYAFSTKTLATPFHYACSGGDLNIVKKFMMVLDVRFLYNARNVRGITPLYSASIADRPILVKYMLKEYKMDLNIKIDGKRPLQALQLSNEVLRWIEPEEYSSPSVFDLMISFCTDVWESCFKFRKYGYNDDGLNACSCYCCCCHYIPSRRASVRRYQE